jgi:tRNA pseudouridine55 synthase
MRGRIEQIPPPVSAKKIGGVPAYKLARRNAPVDLAPVSVSVYELTLLGLEGTRARLRIRCSAGTYVRAIAHRLGLMLGCGAHVESLVRTASGAFDIGRAFTLDRLQALKNAGTLTGENAGALIPAAALLPEFPVVLVDEVTAAHIRQGRDFTVSAFRVDAGAEHVKAVGPDGRLVAIGRIALPHVYHPVLVLGGTA